MKRPDNGLPEDIREHMRLMCDIVALGFQTDKTRVATLLLNRDLSGLFYPFLDVRDRIIRPRTPIDPTATNASRALLQPVCLFGRQVRRDEGGREHGARQFLPDVHVEHVVGQHITIRAKCRCCSPAALAAHWKPAACSTTPKKPTTIANCAASICRSWIAWV